MTIKINSIRQVQPGETPSPFRGPEGELVTVDANGVRDFIRTMMQHAFDVGVNCGRLGDDDDKLPTITIRGDPLEQFIRAKQ